MNAAMGAALPAGLWSELLWWECLIGVFNLHECGLTEEPLHCTYREPLYADAGQCRMELADINIRAVWGSSPEQSCQLGCYRCRKRQIVLGPQLLQRPCLSLAAGLEEGVVSGPSPTKAWWAALCLTRHLW